MTWQSIKEALFPVSQGSPWVTGAYWALLVLFAGLEFFVPQFQDPRRSERWPANFGLGLINMALLPLAPVSALWAAQWAQRHGIGALNFLDASWWLTAAVATILIQSLASYAIHVVMHKAPWLWRVHRVHHFDTAVDFSTGLRHHPLEFVLMLLVDVVVAIAFGLLPWALVAYGTADAMFALFSHANIKYPTRPDRALRLILVTPRVHALHHSSHRPETDSNYGNVFTIWDRLFGTYGEQHADRPEALQFGSHELRDNRAADLWWQLKSPVLRLDKANPALPAQSESSLT